MDALTERLAGRIGKVEIMHIAYEAIADRNMLDDLLKLMYEGEGRLRWHAAWGVEKISAKCPVVVLGERSRIIALVMQDAIPDGLRRICLSVLYNLQDDNSLDVALFNFLLGTMQNIQSSPGVQALAMKLACRMCKKEQELYREFLCIVRNMELDCYSAAVRSVARHCV